MHFGTKNYLKSNRYYTAKHLLSGHEFEFHHLHLFDKN